MGFDAKAGTVYVVGGVSSGAVWKINVKGAEATAELYETTGDAPASTLAAGATVTTNDDDVKVLTVITTNNYPSNDVWELNLDTKEWTKLDVGSIGGDNWATTSVDENIYTFGGFCDGNGTTCGCNTTAQCNDFLASMYDVEAEEWIALPSIPADRTVGDGVGAALATDYDFFKDSAVSVAPLAGLGAMAATLSYMLR